MPSLSLVFELHQGLLLRTALSRTFARPDYVDLVPFELIDLEDEEIETGNPTLDVTSSWNFDAALEWRFSSGSISIAGFYKSLKDFTFRARSEILRAGDSFEVSQPRSGDTADLFGLELALEGNFGKRLPGFSAEFHLTLTDSNTRFNILQQQGLPLPGQAAYSGNLLLTYRQGRFSTAVALSLVDDYFFELGETRDEDLYVDQELRLDLSGDFDLGRSCHIFLQAKNIGDEVSSLFQGTEEQIYRQDFSSRSFVVGLRFDF